MNDAFNYVAVLVSIVTGLAATNLMSGLSEMIQVANRPRIYWIHIVWIFNFFIELMLFWWVLYRWHVVEDWNFFLFVWVTIPAVLTYLATTILFPGELESTGSPDWRDYYYRNRRGIFFILALAPPLDLVDTLLKGTQHFLNQGPLYLPFLAIWFLGCVTAGLTRNEKYHAVWAFLFPIELISYTALQLAKLG